MRVQVLLRARVCLCALYVYVFVYVCCCVYLSMFMRVFMCGYLSVCFCIKIQIINLNVCDCTCRFVRHFDVWCRLVVNLLLVVVGLAFSSGCWRSPTNAALAGPGAAAAACTRPCRVFLQVRSSANVRRTDVRRNTLVKAGDRPGRISSLLRKTKSTENVKRVAQQAKMLARRVSRRLDSLISP